MIAQGYFRPMSRRQICIEKGKRAVLHSPRVEEACCRCRSEIGAEAGWPPADCIGKDGGRWSQDGADNQHDDDVSESSAADTLVDPNDHETQCPEPQQAQPASGHPRQNNQQRIGAGDAEADTPMTTTPKMPTPERASAASLGGSSAGIGSAFLAPLPLRACGGDIGATSWCAAFYIWFS